MKQWMRFVFVGLVLLYTAGCMKPASSFSVAGAGLMDLPAAMEIDGSSFEMAARPSDSATPSQAAPAVDRAVDPSKRLIVYNGTLHIVVENISESLDKIKAMTEKLGGYLQGMSQKSVAIRIPASKFNEAIELTGKIGEITDRDILGEDVTERMIDSEIRLKNLEEMHARLVKLLDKGGKVEELLKIEKELGRITESIETIKGRIKYLKHAVAFSTLTIHLNSPLPQNALEEVIPFRWVRDLGTGVKLALHASYEPKKTYWKYFKLKLPSAYIKLYEDHGEFRAFSGDGVSVLVKREKNFKGAGLAFWGKQARRALTSGKVIAISGEREIQNVQGKEGTVIEGSKMIAQDEFGYLLGIIVGKKYVYTMECWGLKDAMAEDHEALSKAIESLRVK